MTTTTSQPVSRPPSGVGDWLLADARTVLLAVERTVTGRRPASGARLGSLSRAAKAAAGREIVQALQRVLPGQVVDRLIWGWRTHQALAAAARATAGQSGAERLVTLAEHQVRAVQEPTIDIVLDGVHVLTLFWRVEILFDVGEVAAVVRAGRLVAVRAGDAAVTGTVALEGTEVARRSATLPLALALQRGGSPVDLITSTAAHPPPPAAPGHQGRH